MCLDKYENSRAVTGVTSNQKNSMNKEGVRNNLLPVFKNALFFKTFQSFFFVFIYLECQKRGWETSAGSLEFQQEQVGHFQNALVYKKDEIYKFQFFISLKLHFPPVTSLSFIEHSGNVTFYQCLLLLHFAFFKWFNSGIQDVYSYVFSQK